MKGEHVNTRMIEDRSTNHPSYKQVLLSAKILHRKCNIISGKKFIITSKFPNTYEIIKNMKCDKNIM